jgi:hypothetical protein
MEPIINALKELYPLMDGRGSPKFDTDTNIILMGCFGPADEPLVVLAHHREQGLVLAEPRLVWDGHRPTFHARVRFAIPEEWQRTLSDEARAELLAQARDVARRRRKSYRRCAHCKDRNWPGHGQSFEGAWTCHSCMEKRGWVF